MSQTNILKFFSPKPTKRPSLDPTCCSPKRSKNEVESGQLPDSPSRQPLTDVNNAVAGSPVDKSGIEAKRMEAKMKLLQKSTHGLVTGVGPTWFKALEGEFSKDYMKRLGEFVAGERARGTVYPTAENVFSWTRLCPLREVKVVILGQDPYHGPNQAHGLCFSVLRPTAPPPSLLNMYKELAQELPDFRQPSHGDLTGWAEQGVLLLNAVLTVRAHNANSHKDHGWEQLTDAVVRVLNEQRQGLVFMLWGAYAQKKGAKINKKKHKVLTGVHPSPLSAHRGFFGCGHFTAANAYLTEQGRAPIDWSCLP